MNVEREKLLKKEKQQLSQMKSWWRDQLLNSQWQFMLMRTRRVHQALPTSRRDQLMPFSLIYLIIVSYIGF